MSEAAEAGGDVPSNAPEHCPGTQSEAAGKAAACAGCPNQAACATAPKGPDPDLALIAERLRNVQHIVLVLSGKGGVGKSTVATQLAFALAAQGKEVGLLDIDICGPSLPKMLSLEGQEIHQSNAGWSPVYVQDNLGVMSIGFMLPDPDGAVVWRGPRKDALIKRFLKDTDWGALDYLIVDAPPGTSDEHITITQALSGANVDGAVVVTTPQEVAIIDVRKEVNFCRKVGLRVLGVVENMAGLRQRLADLTFLDDQQRDCTAAVLERLKAAAPELLALTVHADVFAASRGGGAHMAQSMGVPFLGRIPLDPRLGAAADAGTSAFEEGMESLPSLPALQAVVARILQATEAAGAGKLSGTVSADANGT